MTEKQAQAALPVNVEAIMALEELSKVDVTDAKKEEQLRRETGLNIAGLANPGFNVNGNGTPPKPLPGSRDPLEMVLPPPPLPLKPKVVWSLSRSALMSVVFIGFCSHSLRSLGSTRSPSWTRSWPSSGSLEVRVMKYCQNILIKNSFEELKLTPRIPPPAPLPRPGQTVLHDPCSWQDQRLVRRTSTY